MALTEKRERLGAMIVVPNVEDGGFQGSKCDSMFGNCVGL